MKEERLRIQQWVDASSMAATDPSTFTIAKRALLRYGVVKGFEFDNQTRQLRWTITLYGALWIFEGALRRWVFPDISDFLLVVRDPIVLYIYYLAAKAGMLRIDAIVFIASVVGLIAFLATFSVGHANLFVALYGLRTLILHLPLIKVMGRALDVRYVNRLSKAYLFIVPAMTALLVVQFYSPPSAFVNIGVGGVGSAGFQGALDRFRPPGTFSFISGTIYFYTLAAAFLFVRLAHGRARIWSLAIAGAAIAVACPLSISRTLLIEVLIVSAVGLLSLSLIGKISGAALAKGLAGGIGALIILSQLPFLKDALETFGARWSESTTSYGGVGDAIVDRFLRGLTEPIYTALDQPIFGNGLGIGTNVGAKLLTGDRNFLGGEEEWFRLVFELGPILGIIYIGLRIAIVVDLLATARKASGDGNPLPMILLSAAALPILQGQWGQPTSLGFSIFSGGLVLAAARIPGKAVHQVRRRVIIRRNALVEDAIS